MNASDDEIADDVLPVDIAEIAVPEELNALAPWHKSRKEFIRINQWGMLAERVINRIKGTPALPQQVGGLHEVKYLTLPGSDYLDVEMIGEIAQGLDCVLTTVGFLAGALDNPVMARAEMRKEGLIEAGLISDRSLTLNRRIEEVTTKSGPAYREMRSRGPYHVINIDACGSIALPGAPENNRLIQVLHTLLEYQFANYRGRWLLYLTSDVRQAQFDPETMERLHEAIRRNAESCEQFKTQSSEMFANGIEQFDQSLDQFSQTSPDNFMRTFSLGIGKWLLALSRVDGWDMKMHPAYCYSTTPEGDMRATMPCLAFEFIPPPAVLPDPIGIAAPAPVAAPQYSERALRVLAKVAAMENLDERMAANDVERMELANSTRERLAKIGYSEEALNAIV